MHSAGQPDGIVSLSLPRHQGDAIRDQQPHHHRDRKVGEASDVTDPSLAVADVDLDRTLNVLSHVLPILRRLQAQGTKGVAITK
jgi:hypothetical protein